MEDCNSKTLWNLFILTDLFFFFESMFVTELCLLETNIWFVGNQMWFVIGLYCGSCGIKTSDDTSEDRSSTVILDSALKKLNF